MSVRQKNYVSVAFALILCLAGIVSGATRKDPGPKVVSKNANGDEIWQVGSSAIEVVDYDLQKYSSKPLRPTVVYNCAFMPAICKNVKQFVGSLPVTGSELTFHADRNTDRKNARRSQACPKNWVNRRKADGTPRCPEPDQPNWSGYEYGKTAKHGPYTAKVHPGTNKGGETLNRLARSWQRITFNQDGTYEKTIEWQDYGALMSCDEFPAATWIEGGAAGNNVKKATEYCAPIRNKCHGIALTTDQDWQADVHNRLKDWINTVHGQLDTRGDIRSKIYTFSLRTVDDSSSPHASWIEANGIKRLCMGPGLNPGGKNSPGCTPDLRAGVDY